MIKSGRSYQRSAALILLALITTLPLFGCGYTLRPPFNPEIRTVYVPVFRTLNTFRRDLNLRLTEEVIKQIELNTPYKVVGNPEEADFVLDGEIISDNKYAVVQNPNNLPRQVAHVVTVEVAFTPNNGNPNPRRSKERTKITESVNSYAELGETVTAAYDKAMMQLARQIVGILEVPW